MDRPRPLVHSALAAAALTASFRFPTAAATSDRTLDIVASEYAYVAPDTVAAGLTRVRMTSRGREPHIAELVRLGEGHAVEELLPLVAARKPLPAWATFVGGPLVPPPGGASEVTIHLAPGRYALLCPIATASDHTPHMAKGMVRTITVLPAPEPSSASRLPAGDVRVTLDDYAFAFEPALTAGRRALRVENRAAQPHEMVIVRLAPGKRADDVVRWARELAGPPPGEILGGTTALSRGEAVLLDLDLRSGDYALLCFAPDQTDGRSHIAHGMVRELHVP